MGLRKPDNTNKKQPFKKVNKTAIEVQYKKEVKPEDMCPECGAQLIYHLRGGEECPICGYWFCF